MAWLAGWNKRAKVTVLASKIDEDLTDFPVYVNLAGDGWADLRVNGRTTDICVTLTDHITKTPRELVWLDATGGQLYFKADAISATVDTDFYVYWDNAEAGEVNSSQVWSNGYEIVSHCQSTTDSSHGYVATNTNVGIDTTPNGNAAWSYNRTLPSRSVWNNPDAGTSWTVTAWIKAPPNDPESTIFGLNGTYAGFRTRGATGYAVVQPSATWVNLLGAAAPRADSGWHRISVSFDTTGDTYLATSDGLYSDTGTGNIDLPLQSSIVFAEGRNLDPAKALSGSLGGVQIASVARTKAWMDADADNHRTPSSFYTVTAVEARKSRQAMFVW